MIQVKTGAGGRKQDEQILLADFPTIDGLGVGRGCVLDGVGLWRNLCVLVMKNRNQSNPNSTLPMAGAIR